MQPQPLSTSTPAIRNALFEETFRESTSMDNYAKNLVFKLVRGKLVYLFNAKYSNSILASFNESICFVYY